MANSTNPVSQPQRNAEPENKVEYPYKKDGQWHFLDNGEDIEEFIQEANRRDGADPKRLPNIVLH